MDEEQKFDFRFEADVAVENPVPSSQFLTVENLLHIVESTLPPHDISKDMSTHSSAYDQQIFDLNLQFVTQVKAAAISHQADLESDVVVGIDADLKRKVNNVLSRREEHFDEDSRKAILTNLYKDNYGFSSLTLGGMFSPVCFAIILHFAVFEQHYIVRQMLAGGCPIDDPKIASSMRPILALVNLLTSLGIAYVIIDLVTTAYPWNQGELGMPQSALDKAKVLADLVVDAKFSMVLAFGDFSFQTFTKHGSFREFCGKEFGVGHTAVAKIGDVIFRFFTHPMTALAHVFGLRQAVMWAESVDGFIQLIAPHFAKLGDHTNTIRLVEFINFLSIRKNRFVLTQTSLSDLILSRSMEKNLGRPLTMEELQKRLQDGLILNGVTSISDNSNQDFVFWKEAMCTEESGVSLLLYVFHIFGNTFLMK